MNVVVLPGVKILSLYPDKAYQCRDLRCLCHTDSVRHCPVCMELYLWYANEPAKPCIECECIVKGL